MTAVALDAMGGDDAPRVTVEGALEAAAAGIEVILVGDSEVLGHELNRLTVAKGASAKGGSHTNLRIVHAPDQVAMGDHAAREVRRQRQTSLYVGMELVKSGDASALVSMGNTGAGMATALVVLGRLKGVERPALGAVIPAGDGNVLFLDVGANADARTSHLVQFAHLGSAYMQSVYGVEHPRVALLSIGEEPSKGSALVIEAHEALAQADISNGGRIRFVGNIEGRDLLTQQADVIVADGFTGNVALKIAEGLVSYLFDSLRTAARSSLRAKVGGLLLYPSLRSVRDRLDYRVHGAVPLLGVDGGVFIGHGRSDGHAVASALKTAQHAVDRGMLPALAASIADGLPK
ncbi:MAG: phosphate acyltransferase PlsX [Chloroflexi bacterium]|nr:MAG: phosphate acyltransferase PlsX [Chloroflexota bacterium]